MQIKKEKTKQNKEKETTTETTTKTMLVATQELFQKKKNAPKIQVKSLKMLQEGLFPSQVAGCKPVTQLKTKPPNRHSLKTSPRPRVISIRSGNT